MKALFICKKNENYGFQSYGHGRKGSGLYNSTHFIVWAMNKMGLDTSIIEVNDNNDIDREVKKHKADVVILEAFWVVPSKFDVLKKLHPNVQWFVHLHSGIPFLAIEGIAMEWAKGCIDKGVGLITNSPESFSALQVVVGDDNVIYLPNVYVSHPKPMKKHSKDTIDIGCFGAIRPLKNQLIQAMAAIKFAQQKDKLLRFHINSTRVETMGQPVLKNLLALFEGRDDAQLVLVPWLDPKDFLHHLEHHIDLSMQVSLSETFNVVSADAVTSGVPIVVSKEVPWASWFSKSADDEIDDIVDAMHYAWQKRWLVAWNQKKLLRYAENAKSEWFLFLTGL